METLPDLLKKHLTWGPGEDRVKMAKEIARSIVTDEYVAAWLAKGITVMRCMAGNGYSKLRVDIKDTRGGFCMFELIGRVADGEFQMQLYRNRQSIGPFTPHRVDELLNLIDLQAQEMLRLSTKTPQA